jgi:hypothetical protein
MGQTHEGPELHEPGSATETDIPFTMLHLTVPAGPNIALESLIHQLRMATVF